MSVNFYPLRVKEVVKETPEAVSIFFDIPDELKEEFKYQHGQYITVKLELGGESQRRAYSISSSPFDGEDISITVKKTEDGFFSKHLVENVSSGDELQVMPPLGSFTIDMHAENRRIYVLIGGGSGITPLISILKSALKKEPRSRVYLFYANRNAESIIFREKLDEMLRENPDRMTIVHILSQPDTGWVGPKGRPDSRLIKELLGKYLDNDIKEVDYFLCGPAGLMNEADKALDELNIPAPRRHKESFTTPVEKIIEKAEGQAHEAEDEELETRTVKINLYAEEHEFEVDPDETILTAAMREGHDPPFSCQLRACATCRAKLISGKVRMDADDALTDEDKEEGYVLTCQSHPISDDVFVDYDES
jgi:ring-1,2-phenylacetyl-CoA epoxidase subunit PaaE